MNKATSLLVNAAVESKEQGVSPWNISSFSWIILVPLWLLALFINVYNKITLLKFNIKMI